MARKYFLIPANYLTFDFQRLLDIDENGRILWQHNSNDPNNMEVGDVCYLYYSNLPDNTNRIILRGIITATGVRDIAQKILVLLYRSLRQSTGRTLAK